jgi:hypothetical protein
MYIAPPTPASGRIVSNEIINAFKRGAACMVLVSAIAFAADPPPGLARKAAERETASEAVREKYLYQQKVLIEEISNRGIKAGEYKETREILFTPNGGREEKLVGKPSSSLVRLILTEEDFRDLREIQPLLLTKERLWLYSSTFRGEETVQNTECWVLEIKPRQLLSTASGFSKASYGSPKTTSPSSRARARRSPKSSGRKRKIFSRVSAPCGIVCLTGSGFRS